MKRKSGVPPVVVVTVLIAYYTTAAVLLALVPGIPGWLRILAGVLALGVSAVILYVLRERLQELRSGETDDLDQY